jgi:RNA polymerase sigma-70 factor (ECF subfamily)
VSSSDDDWVTRAQGGEPAAFVELFRAHRKTVAGIVTRMMGRRGDVEDVVQEVFLQVYRSLPDFRGQAKFSTWLHRVTVNVVLMVQRRAKSRPRYVPEDAARPPVDHHGLPDGEVARARRLDAFRRLLDRLSEKKRTVFVLHELEGLPPAEIAELVGCPVLTVRTRLFYARRELAQWMRSEPSLAAVLDDEEVWGGDREDGGVGERARGRITNDAREEA